VIERRDDYLVRIRPRPDVRVVSQGRTVLATEPDGFFDGGVERGLFVHQTRMLSRYRWLVDGEPPQPVALSNVAQHSWLGYYTCLPPGHTSGPPDQGSGHLEEASSHTLELRLSRYVGGGMHEDVDLTNFSRRPTTFVLTLELDADFADQEETRGKRRQRGRLGRSWREREDGGELALDYRAGHGPRRIVRGLRVRVRRAGSPAAHTRSGLAFRVRLEPQGTWHVCLDYVPAVEGGEGLPLYDCRAFASTDNPHDRLRDRFLAESTGFATRESETLAPVVIGAVEQAKRDLASLRLHDLDRGEREWTMAAGVPVYVALFGRDTLTAAWQAALLGPEMMRGTLDVLARFQGRETNDWRDEQPGRMLHEAHTGPLAALDFHPRRRYYGSVTTSGFYPVIVSELWHWTGDADLVRPLVRPALDALAWLDRYSDRDGDGFYEYLTRSNQGVANQGWKDSGDAIVYDDGRLVAPPIATCEEQAFVYAAKLHLSEVLWWLGEKDEARRLYHDASELKKRFNDAFWMEDEGFFAMALDAQGGLVRSVGSNPGHCVAAGIVDSDRAEPTVRRLMAPDLFSGWGVRTLASGHPAYNPYSYHRGSVWPVEHGSFALGFMRYGLHEPLEALCLGMFEAARLFDFYRLPEVFSGHGRDADHPFPALYPQTNSPQAWSASAVLALLQSLLGLYPYAPLDLLLIDPRLPAWLPEITLRNLRVGSGVVTLRFFRRGEDSTYEVLEKRGRLHIVRQPSPWSLTAGFAERLKDVLSSLLPGA
jgi:glycogen debranching enzyme